ncbi:hypothetical protein JCM15548_1752 [Geofilum rubicundum JCM 15548]|uniref:Uncharacterized protein n=1 Tax=Geofilum rubicundum JCM 15548 TaxID=1236989 RepID=A0A0E9LSS9_9BACT|nr:hypothetical protein JCM15548_1752 [Geofilum rubicundum JCM 15548]
MRLKVGAGTDTPQGVTDFNSTLVRLKESLLMIAGDNLFNFNSTLVRLKETLSLHK